MTPLMKSFLVKKLTLTLILLVVILPFLNLLHVFLILFILLTKNIL